MVEIVFLEAGEEPPANERYLIIEWRRDGFGCAVRHGAMGARYAIGPDKHIFWSTEAFHLARRQKLAKIYYRGVPVTVAVRNHSRRSDPKG